jgi:hypothetical protein
MLHASTMTLVMAEKDQPVFRDFLGLDRGSPLSKQQQQQPELNISTVDVVRGASRSSGTAFDSQGDVETFATRASSGTTGRFETSSAPGYVSPPSCLALPSSSDPCSGEKVSLPSFSSILQVNLMLSVMSSDRSFAAFVCSRLAEM